MKRLLSLSLAFVLAMTLVGCSTSAQDETPEEEPQTLTDADFLANLSKGLEARWALTTGEYNPDVVDLMSDEEVRETYDMFVDTEIEAIGDFSAYVFEDEKLAKYAEMYRKALGLQKQGIQYKRTDKVLQHSQTWDLGYCYRVVCVCELDQEGKLDIDPQYQATLDGFYDVYNEDKLIVMMRTENYEAWMDAHNAVPAVDGGGAMYDILSVAVQDIEDGVKTQKIGTDTYKTAVKLLIPENYSSTENDIRTYLKTLHRYIDINNEKDSLINFLQDSKKQGLMEFANDQWESAAGISSKDFIEKMNLTPEVVYAVCGKLTEYDFKFDFSVDTEWMG